LVFTTQSMGINAVLLIVVLKGLGGASQEHQQPAVFLGCIHWVDPTPEEGRERLSLFAPFLFVHLLELVPTGQQSSRIWLGGYLVQIQPQHAACIRKGFSRGLARSAACVNRPTNQKSKAEASYQC